MSKEKLYMVKNDDGEYWDFDSAGFWRREILGYYAVTSKTRAEIIVNEHGGHVVTLIEEPEKAVLTKSKLKQLNVRIAMRCLLAIFLACLMKKNY